jgi:hypothetical protein
MIAFYYHHIFFDEEIMVFADTQEHADEELQLLVDIPHNYVFERSVEMTLQKPED